MRTSLTISVPEDDAQRIRKLAVLENKTISEYVRSVIRHRWENGSD